MNIRPAALADFPAIIAVERSCGTAAHWSDSEYARVFNATAAPRLLLVAEDGDLAGFIVARTGIEWEIENVAVSPDRRRRGIALDLVRSVVGQAAAQTAESIFLEVRASNVGARALYRRAGFAEIGHRARYYSHPEEDAVLYRLPIR